MDFVVKGLLSFSLEGMEPKSTKKASCDCDFLRMFLLSRLVFLHLKNMCLYTVRQNSTLRQLGMSVLGEADGKCECCIIFIHIPLM